MSSVKSDFCSVGRMPENVRVLSRGALARNLDYLAELVFQLREAVVLELERREIRFEIKSRDLCCQPWVVGMLQHIE